jgi:hypothetical protein
MNYTKQKRSTLSRLPILSKKKWLLGRICRLKRQIICGTCRRLILTNWLNFSIKTQPDGSVTVFGKSIAQVLGEGGSNKYGTTKVFATKKLSRQEIIDYAQSLAGAVPLEEKKTPKGMVYFAKKDGVTINLREYSDSKEQTKARWTIDIVGKSSVGDAVGQKVKKVEIKFR